ncbi:MAG: hypothetical protein AAB385_09455 [Planctomycetota bacterium]
MRVEPLEPCRIRYPKGAYGWVDLRMVTEGHLQALDPSSALTYLFLCTVGNREGISFWNRSRMARTLNLPVETVDAALRTLAGADLIAATERIVQVLPVPVRGASQTAAPQATTPLPTAASPPSTLAHRDPTEEEIHAHEPRARAQIARFMGTRKASAGVVRALARSLALQDAPGGRDE